MTAAAITGEYATYRLVKTRGVLVLEIEVPVERQAEVFAALGYPLPGVSLPVAVARLGRPVGIREVARVPFNISDDEQPVSAAATSTAAETECTECHKYKGKCPACGRPCPRPVVPERAENRDAAIVKRAGILANDVRFWDWARLVGSARNKDAAAELIRQACLVRSRRDLATDPAAASHFYKMLDRYLAETGQRAEIRG